MFASGKIWGAWRRGGSRKRVENWKGIDALEERMLLTVDVRPGGGSFYLTPTSVQNQYSMDFIITVTNDGTTTADMTGALNNPADNVGVRVVMSTDDVYGNGDDTQVGTALFINKTDIA